MSSKKNAKIATATATATSNAASAAKDAVSIHDIIAKHYGAKDAKMHALQASCGVSQQGAAILLHAVCATAKKSIADAKAELNSMTAVCYKKSGEPQAVAVQGGKQIYCESSHYGFLYGTRQDSKFHAFKVYAALKTDIATAYGEAVCKAHKVTQEQVKAHVAKLESTIK